VADQAPTYEQLETEIAELRTLLAEEKEHRTKCLNVARQLRTKVTSLAGYAKLLQQRGQDIDNSLLTEVVKSILETSNQSIELASSLLTGTADREA